MYRAFVVALILINVAFLTGCDATNPVRLAMPTDTRSTDRGVVIGSFDFSKPHTFNSQVLAFRSRDKRVSGELVLNQSGYLVPMDFDTALTKGIVFRLELAPGDYEFYSYQFERSGRMGIGGAYRSVEEFSIPFRVEMGSPIYVGEFISHPTIAKSFFLGLPTVDGGYFVVKDEFERDLGILRRRQNEGDLQQNVRRGLDIDAIRNPRFRTKPL